LHILDFKQTNENINKSVKSVVVAVRFVLKKNIKWLQCKWLKHTDCGPTGKSKSRDSIEILDFMITL